MGVLDVKSVHSIANVTSSLFQIAEIFPMMNLVSHNLGCVMEFLIVTMVQMK